MGVHNTNLAGNFGSLKIQPVGVLFAYFVAGTFQSHFNGTVFQVIPLGNLFYIKVVLVFQLYQLGFFRSDCLNGERKHLKLFFPLLRFGIIGHHLNQFFVDGYCR